MKMTGKVFYNNLKKFTGISSNLQYLQIAKEYNFVTDGYKLMGIYRRDVSGVSDTEECIDIKEEKVVENVKPFSIAHLFPQNTKKVGLNGDNINQMLRFCKAVKNLDEDKEDNAEIKIKVYANTLIMRYEKDNISLVDFFKVDMYMSDLFIFNVHAETFISLLEVSQKTENCIMEYENLFAICPVKVIN